MDDTDPSDESLVASALDGDAAALDRLISRHDAKVLRVLRLLGVPVGDREDVAQEVFIRVFRHLKGFRKGNPFSGWIYRIAVNAAHDHRHRLSRRRRRESEWEQGLDQTPDTGPGPAEEADRRRRIERMEQALEGLSPRERAVFVLCELEGLDSPEAGRALRISAVTVRRHLARARARLQEMLEPGEKKSSGD